MYAFDFMAPTSVVDAVSSHGGDDDATYLAGGQTIIPALKQRLAMPERVVDLNKVAGLSGISLTEAGIQIGALTRHHDVATSADIAAELPALAYLASGIGDPQVRARGTLGGSVANADPAADYPAAVLALNAQIHTDRRTLDGDGFFIDLFETALQAGELITAITFPKPVLAGYAKFPSPASRYPVVGAFVARLTDGAVRVAITGAGPCAFRWAEAEEALAADFTTEVVQGMAGDAAGLNTDLHADSDYRAHLMGVMTARAVIAALDTGL